MAARTADSPDQLEEVPDEKRPVSRLSGHVEPAYWSLETNELVGRLETSTSGLLSVDAAIRLAKFGRNALASRSGGSALAVFARDSRSPLVLILVFAAAVSVFVGEGHVAAIIGAIVLASAHEQLLITKGAV